MEKISVTERIINEKVLRRDREERQIFNLIPKRKKNSVGNILIGERVVKKIVEGRIGKRKHSRGR